MPFDVSGNFTRSYNFVQDKDNGIKIVASRMDGEFDNYATAMNQVFLRNGAVALTGSLNMGGSNSIHSLTSGSVGTPAIRFNADSTSGLYLPAVGKIALTAGGVQRVEGNATGANLTGAITVTGTLAVSSTSAFTGQANFSGGAGFVGSGGTSNITTASSAGSLRLNARQGANVGSFIDFDAPDITTAAVAHRFGRNTNTTGVCGVYVYKHDGSGIAPHQLLSDGNAYFGLTGGAVGIGTNTPSDLLDVRATAGSAIAHIRSDNVGFDGILRLVGSDTGSAYVTFGDAADVFIGGIRYNNVDDSMNFYVNNGYRMFIDSSGNVGIGAAAAGTHKLDVTGSIKLSGNMEFSAASSTVTVGSGTFTIGPSTADASDTALVVIRSGGSASGTRGAYITLSGNEQGSAGAVGIVSGGNANITLTPSGTGAINFSGDTYTGGTAYRQQPTVASKAATTTLTATELLNGLIQSTGAGITLTTPTGTQIDAAVNPLAGGTVGASFDFHIVNTGAGSSTLGAGVGVTIVGNATCSVGTSAMFRARRTAANTYSIYRIA